MHRRYDHFFVRIGRLHVDKQLIDASDTRIRLWRQQLRILAVQGLLILGYSCTNRLERKHDEEQSYVAVILAHFIAQKAILRILNILHVQMLNLIFNHQ